MGMCGGGSDSASDMRQLEAQRQQRITQGLGQIDQIFAGFDPAFYERRKQAYLGYAMPQFGEEYRRTQQGSIYNLADKGLLKSSAGGEQQSALEREAARQQQGLVDAAFGHAQDLRRNVEGQRSSLITQLQASADPNTVAQQALASASGFAAPSVMQPIGGLLNSFANMYLAQQIQNMYRNPYQNPYAQRVTGGDFADTGRAYRINRRTGE